MHIYIKSDTNGYSYYKTTRYYMVTAQIVVFNNNKNIGEPVTLIIKTI